jgi:hypothetical protein
VAVDVKELQRIALENPVALAGQASRSVHFGYWKERRIAVGLTINK